MKNITLRELEKIEHYNKEGCKLCGESGLRCIGCVGSKRLSIDLEKKKEILKFLGHDLEV